MKTVYEVIKRPIVSEKGTVLNETMGTYIFEVSQSSNKQEIKQAVESLFKVNVESIKTMLVHGKTKKRGYFVTKNRNWKKALVTLKKGQKIEIFQGV